MGFGGWSSMFWFGVFDLLREGCCGVYYLGLRLG